MVRSNIVLLICCYIQNTFSRFHKTGILYTGMHTSIHTAAATPINLPSHFHSAAN